MKRQLLKAITKSIIFGVLITFVLSILMIHNFFKQEKKEQMETTLALVFALLNEGKDIDDESDAKELIQKASEIPALAEIQCRVSIISQTGEVWGDSLEPEPLPLDRPEIRQAMAGETGFAARRSKKDHVWYYYSAKKMDRIIVRVAMSAQTEVQSISVLALCCFMGAVAGIVAALISAAGLTDKLINPIIEITNAARAITRGEKVRIKAHSNELGELGEAFSIMSQHIDQSIDNLKENRAQLDAVLQALDDGVITSTVQGCILLINKRARALLERDDFDEGSIIQGSQAMLELRKIIKKAGEGEAQRRRIVIFGEIEKQIDVFSKKTETGGNHSVLTVLTDMTRIQYLENLRSDFVANVTHELKTPLTSISGYIQLLKKSERDEETRLRVYDILDIEAERLTNMIDDILKLSEIESRAQDTNIQIYCVDAVLEEIVFMLQNTAKKYNVSLRSHSKKNIYMRGNPIRMRQLLTNLMENAIKYNNDGGSVDIALTKERQTITIRVKDTGIGIDKEHFGRLFERFYRVDKSRSRANGATGLGLSIVKHIVNLYSGEIHLESSVGEGSTFIVRINDGLLG